jgi:hypothetical protein
VPDLKKYGTTYFMMTKLLSTRSTCGGGFKVEQDNNNNKRKRARLTGRREEVNHLLQVGTEDVLLVLFAAVVQRLVEGPAQSRDQLLKIDKKKKKNYFKVAFAMYKTRKTSRADGPGGAQNRINKEKKWRDFKVKK